MKKQTKSRKNVHGKQDQGLIYLISEQLLQITQNIKTEKVGKEHKHCIKEEMQIADKSMCLNLLVIGY